MVVSNAEAPNDPSSAVRGSKVPRAEKMAQALTTGNQAGPRIRCSAWFGARAHRSSTPVLPSIRVAVRMDTPENDYLVVGDNVDEAVGKATQ